MEEFVTECPLSETPGPSWSLGELGEVEPVATFPEGIAFGHGGVERKEGESGEVFQEWWMLGIDAHVLVADIAVASRDMGLLIHGRRFLIGNEDGSGEKSHHHEGEALRGEAFQVFHRASSVSDL